MAGVRLLLVEDGKLAVLHARMALERSVQGPAAEQGQGSRPAPPSPALAARMGGFVTLVAAADGRLRGCAGSLPGAGTLHQVLAHAAARAARDPRFPPVQPQELPGLVVEVSVLSPPRPLPAATPRGEARVDHVRVGEHGLVVRRGDQRGLLLPEVARAHRMDAAAFLAAACRKAGLPGDAWQRDPAVRIEVFTAETHREEEPQDARR